MPHQSVYEWYIDWADDDYASPLAAIPDAHVASYSLGWGGSVSPTASIVGIAPPQGSLVLFEHGGLYYKPTTNGLTADQLARPHAWKLEIDGALQCSGRLIPTLGISVGERVDPRTWTLQGDATTALLTASEILSTNTSPVQSMAQLVAQIESKSGITIETTVKTMIPGKATERIEIRM